MNSFTYPTTHRLKRKWLLNDSQKQAFAQIMEHNKVDRMVYNLYGLTEEEIAIVYGEV